MTKSSPNYQSNTSLRPHNNFRSRLLNGDVLVGTFVKTPSMMIAEVLSQTDLDVLCFDAEHSPFDRRDLDACLLPCRANAKPSLIRVPSSQPEHILNALDCGATGILFPHVDSAEKANSIIQHATYSNAGRGYAGSTRAANYGSNKMSDNIANGNSETTLIAQIEDLKAVDCIDEISSIDRLDCLFIGMIDLTVALSETDSSSTKVINCIERICESAIKHNKRLGLFTPILSDIKFWKERGVSLFILESDHTFIKKGANQLITTVTSR